MDDLRGQVLGHFRIVDELGRGGMAIVYRAEQTTLGRSVALKVLPPNVSHWTDFTQRFHQEAVHAARLEHPHIVPIYETGEVEGIHFIAMQLVQGHTLKAVIERDGALAPERALHLLEQVAGALDYAHGRGVIHRDVKPSNVLVGEGDWAYLMDFGLARAGEGTGLTMAGTVLGTPAYMSPEQATGKAVDGRSDLYSLGIMLYEMLSGRVPFQAASSHAVLLAHLTEPVPPLPRLRWALPAGVEAVVQRALAKEAGARYESGGALVAALRQALGGQGATLYAVGGEDDLTRLTPAPLGRQGTATGPREATPGDGGVWQPYYTVQGGGGEAVSVRAVPGTKRRPWLYASLGGGVAVLALIITLALTLPGGDRTAQPTPTGAPSVATAAPTPAATGPSASPAASPAAATALATAPAVSPSAISVAGPTRGPESQASSTLAEADRLLENGSLLEAQELYETVLQTDDSNAHALGRLSLIYLFRGRRQQAIDAGERAVQLDANDALARASLAEGYNDLSAEPARLEKATALAEEATSLDPTSGLAASTLAEVKAVRALLLHDRILMQEAAAAAERAVGTASREPILVQAFTQSALAYVSWIDYQFSFSTDVAKAERGITAYLAAAQLAPRIAAFHSNVGYLLMDQGRNDQAEAHLEEARRLDPDLADAHANTGWLRYTEGRYDDAVAAFRRAAALNQGEAGPLIGLGWAYFARQAYDEAGRQFQQAIGIDAREPDAYYGLARTLQEQGDHEGAIQEAIKVQALRPNMPDWRVNVGWVYSNAGKYEQAVTEFQEALKSDDRMPEAWAALGWVHRQQGEYEEAQQALEKAVSLKPRLANGWDSLGWLHLDQQLYKEAVADFSREIEITPTSASAYNGRAWSYYGLGQYDAAGQDFDQAIKYNSTYANAYAGRGWVFLKKGDREEAARFFETALQIDPQEADALNGRKALDE